MYLSCLHFMPLLCLFWLYILQNSNQHLHVPVCVFMYLPSVQTVIITALIF